MGPSLRAPYSSHRSGSCGVWFAAGCVEDGDLPDPWWVDYVRVYALEQQ